MSPLHNPKPHGRAVTFFLLSLLLVPWTEGSAQQTAAARVAAAQLSNPDKAALKSALKAYDQGKHQEAEAALRDLAQRQPRSYEANEALGSLYAEAGEIVLALPYLERSCSLAPREAVAHANLGALYIKLNRNADALHELKLAVGLDPHNGQTQSNLGRLFMLANQPGPATKAFAVAAEAEPEDWEVQYNYALSLFESGSMKAAAGVLARFPAAAATDQVHSLQGEIQEKLGNYKEAALHFQAAAQSNPSDANLYALTLEFLRHWTWDEAIQVAKFAEGRYPDGTHFKVALGVAYYGSSKYPQSAAEFSELLAREPENESYADLLGRSCSLVADGTSADCNGLENFAERHPGNARAATYAAASLLHRPAAEQDTAKVERLLKQAIAADHALPEAVYELGVLYQQRGQWDESRAELERAIALKPEYPEAHYRLSRAYAHLGMREEAQQQIALQQKYSQQEKDGLNARMQEVVTFLLKPS